VAIKSLSMMGTNGPIPSADVLRAAFNSRKGRERRHEREFAESKVDEHEVFDTRLS
jgi:hypothetical protein